MTVIFGTTSGGATPRVLFAASAVSSERPRVSGDTEGQPLQFCLDLMERPRPRRAAARAAPRHRSLQARLLRMDMVASDHRRARSCEIMMHLLDHDGAFADRSGNAF